MSLTLLLIRHGQTEWNRTGRYTGQADIPLTETGRAQAARLARVMQADPPDVIVSSDLQRARETAEIIAAPLGMPVHTDARLREIDQGVWEGMPFPEIKAKFAREFAAQTANPLEVAPPGGETVGQVRDRVMAAVADLAARYPGRRVAVVAHGLALALIKAAVTGHPIAAVWELIPPNAELEAVTIRNAASENQRWPPKEAA